MFLVLDSRTEGFCIVELAHNKLFLEIVDIIRHMLVIVVLGFRIMCCDFESIPI